MHSLSWIDEINISDSETVYPKGTAMAHLSTKPHLVASLNVMLAARQNKGEEIFTQDEIIEILSAMAETEALTSNPPKNQPAHWQTGPARAV